MYGDLASIQSLNTFKTCKKIKKRSIINEKQLLLEMKYHPSILGYHEEQNKNKSQAHTAYK